MVGVCCVRNVHLQATIVRARRIGTGDSVAGALLLLWGCITAINSEDNNSGQIALGLAVASLWLINHCRVLSSIYFSRLCR